MKFKVYKSGIGKIDNFWIIIQTKINDIDHHAVIYTIEFKSEGSEVEVSEKLYDKIQWEISGDADRLRFFPSGVKEIKCKKGYNKNSKLNFGLYHGYELGIVYAFDLTYIEWCIINIESFFINDLQELQDLGVMRVSNGYEENRNLNYAEYFPFIKEFKTIQSLSDKVKILNPNFHISDEVYHLNSLKISKYCNDR